MKFIARAAITDDEYLKNFSDTIDLARLKGNVTGTKGVGRDVVEAFLSSEPDKQGKRKPIHPGGVVQMPLLLRYLLAKVAR